MRVEKVTHGGKVRVVVVQGVDSFPEGLVMAPGTWEVLREPLASKYGPPEEVEREATAEEVAMMAVVSLELRGASPQRGNGTG